MLRIGLAAYKKGKLAPYKVLYTWDKIKQHNNLSRAVPIPYDLWLFARLLERNSILTADICEFQKLYGRAKTNTERLRLTVNPKNKNPLYVSMKHYLIRHGFKRQVNYLGHKMGGDYLLLLFYARVLDTNPNNLHLWFHDPITVTRNYYQPYLSINIHHNVTKNVLIQYIKKNWDTLQKEHLSTFLTKETFWANKRDLRIAELRMGGKTYAKIADQIQKEYNMSMDNDEVKTAYSRIKPKIEAVYQEFIDTKGTAKTIKKCRANTRSKVTTKSPKRRKKR